MAERILRGLVGLDEDGSSIVGDLHEEFIAIAEASGSGGARLWYWRQVVATGMAYARPGRASLDRRRQDLRVALRGIIKEPGFAAAIVTTLALGIGAGTAIFSVVDGVILRPLPFEAPEQLVRVWATNERSGDPYVDLMYSDVEAFRGAGSFSSMTGLSLAPRVMMDARGQNSENVIVARTTPDFFATLGIAPVLGRAYTQADASEAAQLALISYELWERRFTRDPDVVGTFVHLNVRGFEIIGVLPEGLSYPEGAQLWRPLSPGEMEDDDREVHLLARMSGDASASVANAEVRSIAAGLAAETPETHADLSAWLQPLQAMVVRDVRTALFALLGAVGLVLVIACVNTASLLLARSARRSHEVAIRTALGASRGRIVALHLTESVLLAALGGVAGLAVGRWVLSFMLTVSPDLPRLDTVVLDLRVVAVMGTVTALAGILFGVGPALHAANTPPERTLRDGGYSSTHGGGRLRLQSGLVTTEIALSTVLAVLAMLLFSTFRTALTYDRGFVFDNLLAISVDPLHPPEDGDAARAYFGSVLERVQRLGGVRDAALSSHPLLEPRGLRVPVMIEGGPVVTPTPQAYVNLISDGFFATAGIALLEGSGFSESGGVEGDLDIVVNERFAQLHLADGASRLGVRLELDWVTGHVVGVVSDVETVLGEPALPKVYISLDLETVEGASLTVRAITDPAAIVSAIRDEIRSVDPNILLEDVTVVEQAVRTSVAPQKFNMVLVISFAALALTLAGVGIYGVTAFSVATRRSEIGIRRALGASDHRVVLDVVRRVGILTALGVVVGLIGAAAGGRLLSSLLIGIGPSDPAILAAVAALLATIAGGAALVPVLRALHIDPTESLRAE